MKTLLKILATLLAFLALVVILVIALTPWMDTWGATPAEISAALPGDQFVPYPASYVNRAISIKAAPEQVYPWIVQLGAGKGGWYSHTWLEGLINCPMVNADSLNPAWQDLQVGDLVRMCTGDFAPPPYEVVQLVPNQAIVLGHQENGKWVDLYQFAFLPQPDGSTRMLLRTRTMMTGGIWSVIHPGAFIMETGLLQGVKSRAELLAQQ
jgi:hypothetical protein